jgi:hypothetical protein
VTQTSARYSAAAGALVDPTTLVLGNRPLRPGARAEATSRYVDDAWDLSPAIHEGHETALTIHWSRIAPPFVEQFKRYVLVLLTEENPPGLARASAKRLAPKTIHSEVIGLAALSHWLTVHDVTQLSGFDDDLLEDWLHHVTDVLPAAQARVKRPMLLCVQRLAAHAHLLPPDARIPDRLPWQGRSVDDLLNAPKRDRTGNLTPRINEATMTALLRWALMFMEQVSPQVRDLLAFAAENPSAHQVIAQPVAGPKWQTRVAREEQTRRIEHHIELLVAQSGALPGKPDGSIHWGELTLAAGLRPGTLYANPALREPYLASGLPVVHNGIGRIVIDLGDTTWTSGPLTRQDLWTWNKLVHAASFVVIAYLSGMRPGEVLNLKRGCVERDERLDLIKVWGLAWKGVADDGGKVAEGRMRPVPWVVTPAVADAITLLEELSPTDFLFPPAYNNSEDRSPAHHTRAGSAMNEDIREFIETVNGIFGGPSSTPVPEDDHRIHSARFRRTLAWFIVRRPRGLAAASVQYGHLFTGITMGYAGFADAGWTDDLAVERLLAAVDQAIEDDERLASGETVSGPAADEYVSRVRGARRTFAGRVITAARQARQLLLSEDLNIHHGEGMTCVFDLLTAACRTRKEDERVIPDLPGCVSTCRNIARTDRDVTVIHADLQEVEEDLDDPTTPRPLRERQTARREHLVSIIGEHESDATGKEPT